MEKKDNDEPIPKDDGAAGSTPPHNGGKLPPIKIKITKKAAEEASASAAVAEDQVKSHYCKECNKSFSSGKALGGHMSSAHVQANKDYSGKKLSSGKRKLPAASNSGSPEINCDLCGKVFQSIKSLFGHMRCHPERYWRGMDPPESKIIGSSSSSGDEDDVVGDQIDPGRHELGFSIMGWPTSKRGRGAVSDPTNRAESDSFSLRSEKGPIVAGQKLLKKLSDESRKEELGGIATDGGGKGKEKVGCTDQEPDGIDPNDELVITAIEVLANGKRAMEAETASSSQFRCTLCDKVFSKHQALGGHCASHYKFKMTVVNTISRPAKPETPLRKRKATPKKEKPVVKSNAEAPASASASFAFDLNMAPAEEAEEEEKDMEGLSNNTSPDHS